jgi:hypothetical protein
LQVQLGHLFAALQNGQVFAAATSHEFRRSVVPRRDAVRQRSRALEFVWPSYP